MSQGRHTRLRSLACLPALLAGLSLGACGDSDAPSPTVAQRDPPPVPTLAAAPDETLATLRSAVRERDCPTIAKVVHSAYGASAPSFCDDLIRQLPTLPENPAYTRYGTAAVVDFSDRDDRPRALVLAMDRTNRLRIVFVATSHKAPFDATARRRSTAAAREGVRAIRANDCTRFLRVAQRANGVGDAPREEVCVALTNLDVVPYLQTDTTGAPEAHGGDGAFGFYVLRLGRAGSQFRGVFTVITQRLRTGEWKFVTVLPS